ncbi:MAG: DUF424 family protein [Candidatus Woesearchaeota archaeon]|nr:DUF424 family protein [Candidatus Woesearchaeota archaeon]
MYLKIHERQNRKIIAVCDKELIGKTFEEKDLQLKVSEHFYKGSILPEQDIIKILKDANNINLVGKKAIELAIKNNIISKNHVIKIQGVPHAQIFSL